MKQFPFQGRILILGCGGVAKCTLPLLLRHLDMPAERITVMDMEDCRDALKDALRHGVRFIREQIVAEKLSEQLGAIVGPGDMIVDLAWNISCVDLLEWCYRHDVRYVNTSVELWDPYSGAEQQQPTDRTLYVRHMAIRELIAGWVKERGEAGRRGPTAILEHGANPGLVSHFTKLGLIDIAKKIITEKPRDARVPALEAALDAEAFNRLAQLTGVKVIHISERDTQVSAASRTVGEFVNTWSAEGFFEESIAPAEMGWGTHELRLPADGHEHQAGPRNQICLDRFGMNTYVRSRVPSGDIVGMVIRHGESFSISEALTVHDDAGRAVYRPTVHYAYRPCDLALASLTEMKLRGYKMQESWRIMSDDITSGHDELGCLLMGHDFQSWWTGTILDITEARLLVPGQNATTLQVAASVLGAVVWMIHHPHEGVHLPDQLPHEEIMQVARPYLGNVVSLPIEWMPGTGNSRGRALDPTDEAAWQFERFLLERAPRVRPSGAGRRPAKRPIPYVESTPVSAGKVVARRIAEKFTEKLTGELE